MKLGHILPTKAGIILVILKNHEVFETMQNNKLTTVSLLDKVKKYIANYLLIP